MVIRLQGFIQSVAASCLIALILPAQNLYAIDTVPDAITISHGKYTDTFLKRRADLSNTRISVRWDWDADLIESSSVKLDGYFDLGYSQWKSHLSKNASDTSVGADKAWAVSFTPVLRFKPRDSGMVTPFLDIGGGISYQSEENIQKKKPTAINMGGHTQFEARVAVGVRVNTAQPVEASLGFMHYSNANFHSANEALDFYMFNLTWVF